MKDNRYQENNQYTYINGLGFIPQTPKQLERRELIMRYNFMFISLIVYHILSTILIIPMVKWLATLGLDIRINPITGFIYKNDFSWQFVMCMVYVFSMLLPILLLYPLIKNDLHILKMFKVPNKFSMKYGIVIIIGCSIICNTISIALSRFLNTLGIVLRNSNQNFVMQNSTSAMVVYIISLTIVPAILEEIFFRGIIISGLRRFGDFIAIAVSATLYAFSEGSIQDALYSFLMGLVLGYFTLRAGSLIVPILANFIIKCMYIGFWLIKVYEIDNNRLIMLSVLVVLLVASLIAFGLFISKDKYAFCIDNRDTNLTNRDKLKYFVSNIGFWILCSIVFMKCISSMQIIN